MEQRLLLILSLAGKTVSKEQEKDELVKALEKTRRTYKEILNLLEGEED